VHVGNKLGEVVVHTICSANPKKINYYNQRNNAPQNVKQELEKLWNEIQGL
jgi:hypothetical protein